MPVTWDPEAFSRLLKPIERDHTPVPVGIFMVSPASFRVDAQSAVDNRYMNLESEANEALALRQFHALSLAVASCGVPTICFPGEVSTPDGVFPNNVFGTAPGCYLVGSMCHPTRRLEAERRDIRGFFSKVLGREEVDLSQQACVAELTGTMIIDRARLVGFCGMTERVDARGAELMHEGFGLRATLCFGLRETEYHTNVVMSILAGRALLVHLPAIPDPRARAAILASFPDRLELDAHEIESFAGNCLAVTDRDVLMSERAADALEPASRRVIEGWGFRIHAVDVSELEKAGGSVRCMLGEIF